MDDHSMRRYVPLLIAGSAFIAAACSDAVAPARPTSQAELSATAALVPFVGFNASLYDRAQTYRFKLSANGGKAKIGAYTLTYGANAVCDPATSSYGPTEWQKRCKTLSKSITIVARFWVEDGRTYADFSPDIRFDPSRNVTISTRVPGLRGADLTDELRSAYAVGYTRVVDGYRYFIDEAADDPSLATVFGMKGRHANGLVSRRVLHFSGYYVRSGRVCDESSDECGDGSIETLDSY